MDFLDHSITQHGATPLPDKVEMISQFKKLVTVKGLQEFIGMINFYHRFIPEAARVLQPLYAATASRAKILEWSEVMVQACGGSLLPRPDAIPLSDTSTITCAQALVTNWIARFGVPMDMSSGRGSQFTSHLWASISQLLGTKLHHTTAYHPQANGRVERFHRHEVRHASPFNRTLLDR